MQAPREALAGLQILVVEDELMIAMLLEEMLQELGCQIVGPVGTLERAVAAVRQQCFHGVLLDANLHGKNSSPVADELLGRAVPFLLVTGYGSRDGDLPVFKTAPRVKKPIDLEQLADRMMEAFVGVATTR